MPRRPLSYLQPHCPLTLREGVRELRAAEGVENDAAAQVATELTADLDVHDAIHVLFACPTTLTGEIAAHVWTMLGTTARLRDLHRVVQHRDHRQVLRDIGHVRLLKTWCASLGSILFTAGRALRMTRRWSVQSLEDSLDRPLVELRRELGIRVPPTKNDSNTLPSSGAALRHVRRPQLTTNN